MESVTVSSGQLEVGVTGQSQHLRAGESHTFTGHGKPRRRYWLPPCTRKKVRNYECSDSQRGRARLVERGTGCDSAANQCPASGVCPNLAPWLTGNRWWFWLMHGLTDQVFALAHTRLAALLDAAVFFAMQSNTRAEA
ncbi:hypothetical protein [Marinobacter sp. KMM 10035]|uniref:hypothetical protein n=1 Tax=Marinobacter sp. KMM 10035 TaxID=3134034 RepID=UPI00397CCB9A